MRLHHFGRCLKSGSDQTGRQRQIRCPVAATLGAVDARSVHQPVERLGIMCPSIDDQLIAHYLTALVRVGYLPAPWRLPSHNDYSSNLSTAADTSRSNEQMGGSR
jgi:hypothetical protein